MRNKAFMSIALPACFILALGLRADTAAPGLADSKPQSAMQLPQPNQSAPVSALGKGPEGLPSEGPASALKSPAELNNKPQSYVHRQLKILNEKVKSDEAVLDKAKQGSDTVLILNARNQLKKDKAALGSLRLKPSSTPSTTPSTTPSK